jgi:hypothetical protein
MSAISHQNAPLTLAQRAVDTGKPGSVWSQALTGVVGITLAIVLIAGQVSLATTKNISKNLHQNVTQLQDGNVTMASVIERSEPSVMMEKTIGAQSASLKNTSATMQKLNKEMATSGKVTDSLMKTTSSMNATSLKLANGVKKMNADTARMLGLLQTMPAATDRTQKNLQKLSNDTRAINAEMKAIGQKMKRFGLPEAKGVKRR